MADIVDIDALRALLEKATKGPVAWMGGPHNIYLATTHSGRIFIMGFKRMGINGAQPVFPVNHAYPLDTHRYYAYFQRVGRCGLRKDIVMAEVFKTTVLGVGPWCVEFPDGEIVTCRTEDRARRIADFVPEPGSHQEAAALGFPIVEPPCPECGATPARWRDIESAPKAVRIWARWSDGTLGVAEFKHNHWWRASRDTCAVSPPQFWQPLPEEW